MSDEASEPVTPDPRIGVFVCACGKNIAGTVDVKSIAERAENLENVVYSEWNKFTCSESGQRAIQDKVKEHGLDRFLVASCSPRLHGETFNRCAEMTGLNRYMTEMANIREHCSWVHLSEPDLATEKAYELIEMGVSKIRHNQPLEMVKVPMDKTTLVIGAGVGGIQTALDLADTGYKVYLIEKKASIGGNMALIDKTFPTIDCSICILGPKMNDVKNHPNIELISNAEVKLVSGFVGSFDVEVELQPRYVDDTCTGCGDCEEVCPVQVPSEWDANLGWRKAIYMPFPQAVPPWYIIDEKNCLGFNPVACGKCADVCEKKSIDYADKPKMRRFRVGTIAVATGFQPFDATRVTEYGWGRYPNVLTTFEFERLINASGPTEGDFLRPSDLSHPHKVAFIQCVGSRNVNYNEYCSNFCCMETIKDVLLLKDHYPDIDITVFYIDIRAFGKGFEDLYKRARETGAKFIQSRPSDLYENPETKGIRVNAEVNGEFISPEFDVVVLSIGADGPRTQIPGLPLSMDNDGFLVEAHPKLRPVDTASDGIFLVGGCESPKDIRDTVTQASAATARAGRLMSKGEFEVEPIFAQINEDICTACGICVTRCPYGAISIKDKKAKTPAVVNTALCKGCGTCAGDCPNESIRMNHFTDIMYEEQLRVALRDNPEEKVISYCCNWCSYAGSDTAGVGRMQYPANIRIIRTMCSGRVHADFITKAFELGAGGVLLTGCHPADCHYISGNAFAAKRERRIRSWLKKNNVDQRRFAIDWISATEGKKFKQVMTEMGEFVKASSGNVVKITPKIK
ncbi:MAG: hydrogenase iron-sulfur subunit [Candidatus Hodarchaeales archaeon]|jgi:heterodisulfide reductase subunit A